MNRESNAPARRHPCRRSAVVLLVAGLGLAVGPAVAAAAPNEHDRAEVSLGVEGRLQSGDDIATVDRDSTFAAGSLAGGVRLPARWGPASLWITGSWCAANREAETFRSLRASLDLDEMRVGVSVRAPLPFGLRWFAGAHLAVQTARYEMTTGGASLVSDRDWTAGAAVDGGIERNVFAAPTGAFSAAVRLRAGAALFPSLSFAARGADREEEDPLDRTTADLGRIDLSHLSLGVALVARF